MLDKYQECDIIYISTYIFFIINLKNIFMYLELSYFVISNTYLSILVSEKVIRQMFQS